MVHRFVMCEVRDRRKFCQSYCRLNGTTDIIYDIHLAHKRPDSGSVAHPASHLLSIWFLYQAYTGLGVLTFHLHPMPSQKMNYIHNQLPTHRHPSGWHYSRPVPATDYYHETPCIVE